MSSSVVVTSTQKFAVSENPHVLKIKKPVQNEF